MRKLESLKYKKKHERKRKMIRPLTISHSKLTIK